MRNSKKNELEEVLRIAGDIRKVLRESGVPKSEVDTAIDQVMGAINKAFYCIIYQDKARVIVIDDEEIVLRVLKMHFENQGYDVIASVDPEVCDAFFRDIQCLNPPGVMCGDILITDNQMPRIRGIEFIESQLQRDCKISVECKAVMSGNFKQEDIERIDKIGCARFEKPISLVILDAWASHCVSRIDKSRRLRGLVWQ